MIPSCENAKTNNFIKLEHQSEMNETYLNNLVSGFQSGTGILRTLVPAGRKLRKQMCVDKLPNSQSCYRKTKFRFRHFCPKKISFKMENYRETS